MNRLTLVVATPALFAASASAASTDVVRELGFAASAFASATAASVQPGEEDAVDTDVDEASVSSLADLADLGVSASALATVSGSNEFRGPFEISQTAAIALEAFDVSERDGLPLSLSFEGDSDLFVEESDAFDPVADSGFGTFGTVDAGLEFSYDFELLTDSEVSAISDSRIDLTLSELDGAPLEGLDLDLAPGRYRLSGSYALDQGDAGSAIGGLFVALSADARDGGTPTPTPIPSPAALPAGVALLGGLLARRRR